MNENSPDGTRPNFDEPHGTGSFDSAWDARPQRAAAHPYGGPRAEGSPQYAPRSEPSPQYAPWQTPGADQPWAPPQAGQASVVPSSAPHPSRYEAYPVTAPAQKRATLGIVSFVIMVLVVIAGLANANASGQRLAEVFAAYGMDTSAIPADDPLMVALGTMVLLGFVIGLVGLVAFILAIVAAATNRGRIWAVLALILGPVGALVAYLIFSGVGAAGL